MFTGERREKARACGGKYTAQPVTGQVTPQGLVKEV
jgi:hypothetical protein